MKPLNWLSVKWALLLPAMFESNQTWYMEKVLLQYIVCAGKVGKCLVAWSGNNQDLCLCLWFPSLAFSRYDKSWTLPLYGFWLWFVCECEYHHTDKKGRSTIISKMIVHVCSFYHQWLWQSFSGGCNIIALLGSKTFLECHVLKLMWLCHNQKHSVCYII